MLLMTVITVAAVAVMSLFLPIGFIASFTMITVVIVMVGAFFARFRLTTMPGKPENVLRDLAHRLRVSGYRVDQKSDRLVVQVSSLTSVNIRAKASDDGAQISYWAGATPNGWSLILILTIVFFPLAIGAVFGVFFKSVVFATERVLPRLSQLPPGDEDDSRQVRALLIDSLAEGRRLSAEAYEAATSNYQDVIVISFAATFLGSLVAGVLIAGYGPSYLGGGSPAIILVSLVAGLAIFAIAFRWLSKKRRPALDALRGWSETLEVALNREVAKLPPPDGVPSSLELIGESCRMIPDWLGVRKRGGRFREPGDWLVIGLLAYAGCMMLATGILLLVLWPQANGAEEALLWGVGLGSAFLAAAILVYVRWRRRQSKDSSETMQDWSTRCRTLKSNLQDLLEDV